VDVSESKVYIFQEWVPGGSVSSLVEKFGPLKPSVVRNYTRQILEGKCWLA
jgi:serine/threonine protein kinase